MIMNQCKLFILKSNKNELPNCKYSRTYLGVSKNSGTPKWMVYKGKPYYIELMIWGYPLFLEGHPFGFYVFNTNVSHTYPAFGVQGPGELAEGRVLSTGQ